MGLVKVLNPDMLRGQSNQSTGSSSISGSTNSIAKFASSSTLGNSTINDDGTFATFNKGVAETYLSANPSSNVVTIDLTTGTVFNVSLSANITSFTIDNAKSSKVSSFTLFLKQDAVGSRTITWTFTGKTLKWPNNTVPTLTLSANKTDVIGFITNDGGSTWYGFLGGRNF